MLKVPVTVFFNSGVARVLFARGQNIFSHPDQKNCKSVKKETIEQLLLLLLLFFNSNKMRLALETHSTKW